jgi:hypothetical protein
MPRIWVGSLLVFIFVGSLARADEKSAPLVEMGKRVQERVAKLRGLSVAKPIRWEIVSKKQIRKYIIDMLRKQYAPGELENEGLAFKALGLLPESLEYKEYIVSMYEEQVGGYYDPLKDTFFLADWMSPAMQETIVVHELTHALQDQYFGLDGFVERLRGNTDAMLARSALIEGGATLVMMKDSMGAGNLDLDYSMFDMDGALGQVMIGMTSAQFPKFSQAPRFLQQVLMFPYLAGLNFVGYGKKLGGWKKIDRVYTDLPSSSEQIIHPEKYFDKRDPPTRVSLDFVNDLDFGKWERIYRDVLGEFMIQQVLDPSDDYTQTTEAAAGWDGDAVLVYKQDERLAFILISVWDSERDAIEFASLMAQIIEKKETGYTLQPTSSKPEMVWQAKHDARIQITRRANRVLVVKGFESSLTGRIVQAFPD